MMSSSTYQLFRKAILGRKQITCTYQQRHRELCPHVLGRTDGQEKALTYQFAGESTSGLPRGGEWRCLSLAHVHDARMRDGAWHTGFRHTKTQVCVDVVDVDVNL
jgi:hypothetical protein